MGMAATQARLLCYMEHKNDTEFKLSMFANDKTSLARDMQKVTNEYQNALNQKVLKWSYNSGVTHIDLTYNNLMNPGIINQNSLNLITDLDGKPVISNNYLEYAKRISPDGKPGGDWESNRTEILSELTGIDPEKIENMGVFQDNVQYSGEVLDAFNAAEPQKPYLKESFSDILTAITDLFSVYPNGIYEVSNINELNSFIQTMQGFGETLADADLYKQIVENRINQLYQGGQNRFTIENLVKDLFNRYFEAGGEAVADCNGVNNYSSALFYYYDKDSPEYKEWEIEHAEWEELRNAALDGHNKAIDDNNQLLTRDQENLIKSFNGIFSTIAEKGWTFNEQVEDPQYLNQMLQNNLYTITTVNQQTDCKEFCDDKQWENSYTTNIAGNNPNIFAVSDEELRAQALINYENKKSIINQKEKSIDIQMGNLQTTLAAIQQMIKGLETTIDDYTQKKFSFGANG